MDLVKGGNDYIITHLCTGMHCLRLAGYVIPTTLYKNQNHPLTFHEVFCFVKKSDEKWIWNFMANQLTPPKPPLRGKGSETNV